jgi:hypothetical protein
MRSIVGALGAALLLAAQGAAAETKAWDQAAVAKLGADLAKACVGLYNEYYAEQGINPKFGSGDAADSFKMRYKLQRIEEVAEGLSGALAAGKGRDATTTRMEDLGVLSRDLKVLLARMYVMAPLEQRVDAAREIWLQMLPYYGIAPPPDAPAGK